MRDALRSIHRHATAHRSRLQEFCERVLFLLTLYWLFYAFAFVPALDAAVIAAMGRGE